VKTKSGPKKKNANEDLKKYGQPLDYTYLMGSYMAVNAVAGTAILIDGPDCAMGKVEHIFGKHDLRSTLLECTGLNRVECSFTDARNTVMSREKAVHQNLVTMARRSDLKALLLSSLPMTFVTGTDYNLIIQNVSKETKKPLHYVLPRSLNGGHLEGYVELLRVFAEDIALQGGRTDRGKVAIVGYFMDRMEEDHLANVRELKRLLGGIGLDAVSVWFDGSDYSQLDKVAEAGTLLAFPYGKKAADIISKRTGAQVLSVDMPIGIDGTRKWLEYVADFFGRKKKAKSFIESELRRVIPRMEWAVPHYFLNRRFWISMDPYHIGPWAAFMQELGAVFVGGATVGEQLDVRAGRSSGKKDNKTVLPENVSGALVRPTSGCLEEELKRAFAEGVDIVFGNTDVLQLVAREIPTLEIGYPSYYTHALAPAPYMGFEGALWIMDRAANAISSRAAHRAEKIGYDTGSTIRSG